MNGIGIRTIACGLSHSGCVMTDGTVYLWGIAGDIQYSKELMEKSLLKKPTKISFRSSDGSLSHRRRSGVNIDDSSASSGVVIEDFEYGKTNRYRLRDPPLPGSNS